MTEVPISIQPQPKTITYNGRVAGIQLDLTIAIRIYMKSTSPQRFGVSIIRELPDLLKQDSVRKALGIPDFDNVVVRESTHSPLEADLTLLLGKNVVEEFSVKASPTGNLDYIAKSWRAERGNYDLLAIIPLEGRKRDKDLFFIALIRIPKALKAYSSKDIKKYILSVIDAKRADEGLDRLWPTDFSELYAIARDQATLRFQMSLLETLKNLLKTVENLLKMQENLLKMQEDLLKMQKETSEKLDQAVEALEKIYKQLQE